MNFLTLIFSLLLIFSFGMFVSLEKQADSRRLRSSFLGHVKANRKILSKWESETYQSFSSIPKSVEKTESSSKKKERDQEKKPSFNPDCAKINLMPLTQGGRAEHPVLYETTLKLLKKFYGRTVFGGKMELVDPFLEQFLKKAKEAIQKEEFALEKISLSEPFQWHYYKMLKGTKQWSIKDPSGYPSLLDMVKLEKKPSKVCLHHANAQLMALFFGEKAADKIYEQMHEENALPLSKEAIETVCLDAHMLSLDRAIFELLELNFCSHTKCKKKTLIAEDRQTKISLRKTLYTRSNPS